MTNNKIPPDWAPLLKDFQQRLAQGRSMGGEEKLAKRHLAGKKNARQMINLLVDDDSFMELGTLVGGVSYSGEAILPCDAVVGGLATIDGRPVVLACEDFTVKGGSIGHGANAKRLRLARLAAQEQIPYILMLDGAGARATNSLERHPYAPNDMQEIVRLSGIAPTVALIYGSSAGHGAISGLLMDFVVMTKDATVFSAGPPLVAAALGEMVSKEELGSAEMHTSVSGVAHNLAEDEAEACAMVRRYLSYLPSNCNAAAPTENTGDINKRQLEDILTIIPRNGQSPYDMNRVLERLFDSASVFHFQPRYGRTLITALARLGGQPVAVVANQPSVMAGSITADGADKAAHFIELAGKFGLPVVFLADNPGVMSGTQAERAGTLRAAAHMYAAQSRLPTPKLHITLRKAFGFGSSLMAMNPFDSQTISLALPGVALGGIPSRGGDAAAGLDEETARKMAEAEAAGSWATADNMAFDEIIDPRDMRNALLKALSLSQHRLGSTQ